MAGCDRKATYARERSAEKKLREMKRKAIDPFRLAVYYCEKHHGWHIGNRPLFSQPGDRARVEHDSALQHRASSVS